MKLSYAPLTLLLVLIQLFSVCFGQESLSLDELFQQARKAAFDNKDYPTAINLSKEALKKSPGYLDIKVFLGRLYTWSDKTDSARTTFESVLTAKPGHEDASVAYGSLEYWNNNSQKALKIVDAALRDSPNSKDLLLLKGKILNDLSRFSEANTVIEKLLSKDPRNTEARAISQRIKENSSSNNVGLSYDFVYFDKQFDDPWHLASLSYGRQTKLGSVSTSLNFANRFSESGLQAELSAYPRISKTFYTYVGLGYSADVGIFPKFRSGFSLYANLPAAFEGEAGFRYLKFSSNTTVYTLSAGKYYKNYWFNLRTYLTPSHQNISQSYSLTTRYYYGAADDYVTVSLGTGISPDDTGSNILLNNTYKLKSNNISVGYRHAVMRRTVLSLSGSLQNQEYRRGSWGNQIGLSLGFQQRF